MLKRDNSLFLFLGASSSNISLLFFFFSPHFVCMWLSHIYNWIARQQRSWVVLHHINVLLAATPTSFVMDTFVFTKGNGRGGSSSALIFSGPSLSAEMMVHVQCPTGIPPPMFAHSTSAHTITHAHTGSTPFHTGCCCFCCSYSFPSYDDKKEKSPEEKKEKSVCYSFLIFHQALVGYLYKKRGPSKKKTRSFVCSACEREREWVFSFKITKDVSMCTKLCTLTLYSLLQEYSTIITFREEWLDERLKYNDYNGKI